LFQFSVRQLVITFAGIGCVLGVYRVFGVSAASLVVFLIGLGLLRFGPREQVFFRCIGCVLATISGICLLALLIGWSVLGIGPVYSESAWPAELSEMADRADVDKRNVKVSRLGGFLDREQVWRLSVAADRLDDTLSQLSEFKVEPVPSSDVPPEFWTQFPRWWRPVRRHDSLFFSSPEFPANLRGEDGYHYFVMYDPHGARLYVWFKSNF